MWISPSVQVEPSQVYFCCPSRSSSLSFLHSPDLSNFSLLMSISLNRSLPNSGEQQRWGLAPSKRDIRESTDMPTAYIIYIMHRALGLAKLPLVWPQLDICKDVWPIWNWLPEKGIPALEMHSNLYLLHAIQKTIPVKWQFSQVLSSLLKFQNLKDASNQRPSSK